MMQGTVVVAELAHADLVLLLHEGFKQGSTAKKIKTIKVVLV
jgi:hypothetical protein